MDGKAELLLVIWWILYIAYGLMFSVYAILISQSYLKSPKMFEFVFSLFKLFSSTEP